MKIQALILDESVMWQQAISRIIERIAKPDVPEIFIVPNLAIANKMLREKSICPSVIILDRNMKAVKDINDFFNGLSEEIKAKVIILSEDDDFRSRCYVHLHAKVASKRWESGVIARFISLHMQPA